MSKPQPRLQERFAVILSHPEDPENIGLVARHMKNTGFGNLKLVLGRPLELRSYVTAVHAKDVLNQAAVYANLYSAVSDLEVVFAAVARKRKNFPALSFDEALDKMLSFLPEARIGLLFGNERTGLSSKELRLTNFRFTLPQATRQPSYNLASAVLLTLFQIFRRTENLRKKDVSGLPISREEQEDCIALILRKLEERGFIHPVNRTHVTEMVHDLFGRLTMTERDRSLLLAIFSKGLDNSLRSTKFDPKG